MGSRKAAARRRFDRWAATYGRDRRSRFHADPQRRALTALGLRADDRFLDVGCGTGAAVRAAAEVVDRAVGVDLSPAMVDRARELAGASPRAEFVVGDSEQLPFASAEFTALLCTSSFHHYPEPRRALAERRGCSPPAGVSCSATGRATACPPASPTACCGDSTAAMSASTRPPSWSCRSAPPALTTWASRDCGTAAMRSSAHADAGDEDAPRRSSRPDLLAVAPTRRRQSLGGAERRLVTRRPAAP